MRLLGGPRVLSSNAVGGSLAKSLVAARILPCDVPASPFVSTDRQDEACDFFALALAEGCDAG